MFSRRASSQCLSQRFSQSALTGLGPDHVGPATALDSNPTTLLVPAEKATQRLLAVQVSQLPSAVIQLRVTVQLCEHLREGGRPKTQANTRGQHGTAEGGQDGCEGVVSPPQPPVTAPTPLSPAVTGVFSSQFLDVQASQVPSTWHTYVQSSQQGHMQGYSPHCTDGKTEDPTGKGLSRVHAATGPPEPLRAPGPLPSYFLKTKNPRVSSSQC